LRGDVLPEVIPLVRFELGHRFFFVSLSLYDMKW
jgi:hypothetical protein